MGQTSAGTEKIKTLIMQNKGVLTLPSETRERYQLGSGALLIVEERAEGILLKPAVPLAIEFYDDARVQEFLADDDQISDTALNKARKAINERKHQKKIA